MGPTTLRQAISNFQTTVFHWNKTVFGNIFVKLKTTLARLDGIQKSPHYHFSPFLHNLENELLTVYEGLLRCEVDFWKIKSIIDWLSEGNAIPPSSMPSPSTEEEGIRSLS